MHPLSALDAIGPAWNHTRRLLWDKRDWRLLLKIGFIACLAGVGGISGGNNSFNRMGNFGNSGHEASAANWPALATSALAAIAAAAVLLFIVGFVVFLVMLYISSRLKFVLFEVVLRSDTTVGPIWQRYGAATWRWIGLRLILISAALACMAPFLIPAIVHFVHVLHQAQKQPSDMGIVLATFLGLFAMAFLLALVFAVINILLHDFGLPSMALESTSIGQTVARVWRLVRAEPGQVLLYLLMRFIFGFAGAWCAHILIAIATLIALIPFGIVAGIDFVALHNAGGAGKAVMVAIFVLLGLFFLAFIFVATFILVGYLATFIQAYALYFLGGRYPLVGQYLAPYWPKSKSTAPPPQPYDPPPTPPAFQPPTA